MTTEEVLEIEKKIHSTYRINEERTKQAQMQAEIITVLKKYDLNYPNACFVLEHCKRVIGFMTRF